MILGVDLGGTNIRIGQIAKGKIQNKISESSPSDESLENSLEYIKDKIRSMITDDVEGIGIGVPSVLDISKGIVYNATNIPSWKEVHLKDLLLEEFNLPVYINNDSNCFVLGEKEYGSCKEFKDIVGVTLGTGVGTGIVINNTLYGGRNTGAGEIGSLPYLDATFEDYCGSDFFVRQYNTTGKVAAIKARQGDTEAIKIWEEYGIHAGHLVQAILYVYDPEIIIFGGGIAESYPLFEKKMKQTMNSFPYPETIRNIQIAVSEDADISILGAAALASNKILTY
ncbi:MAG: ROK family protein [Bacteroides sp.]|nr:ROK family protein [Bacteroides sp.]